MVFLNGNKTSGIVQPSLGIRVTCLILLFQMQRDKPHSSGRQRRDEQGAKRRWYPSLNVATCKQQRQGGRAAKMRWCKHLVMLSRSPPAQRCLPVAKKTHRKGPALCLEAPGSLCSGCPADILDYLLRIIPEAALRPQLWVPLRGRCGLHLAQVDDSQVTGATEEERRRRERETEKDASTLSNSPSTSDSGSCGESWTLGAVSPFCIPVPSLLFLSLLSFFPLPCTSPSLILPSPPLSLWFCLSTFFFSLRASVVFPVPLFFILCLCPAAHRYFCLSPSMYLSSYPNSF
ncbi:uncharacterized protein LOC127028112 isoform X2 [Gymnogyps californianus]|uniref:uncharacterized protein LOC127028112 isoform X2 n=1 Tax=Gymnogyps californianus TaxID=33616 RepID=UPI0021C96360|nr:uncharacterized protein LOC127028112 isoform X2 [Gymnogyps californianus]